MRDLRLLPIIVLGSVYRDVDRPGQRGYQIKLVVSCKPSATNEGPFREL